MNFRISSLSTAILLLLFFISCTQNETPEAESDRRKSPIAITTISHDDTYIKIVYGQPYKRGRDIFGGLVPYGEVWRTGANEATELTTTHDILIGGQRLEAGTYALFTIPGPKNWTVILNGELGQWGAFDYNSSHDVFRFKVPSTEIEETYEAFTIQFTDVNGDSTAIHLSWENTRVAIPVSFIPSSDSSTT